MEIDISVTIHDSELGRVDLIVELIFASADAIYWNWPRQDIGFRPVWTAERGNVFAIIDGKEYTPTKDDLEAWEFDIKKAQEKALERYIDSRRSA